jgi:hypothetical protein
MGGRVDYPSYNHAGYLGVYADNGDEIGWPFQNLPAHYQPTNRYPGGFKLATYNGVPIGTLLDTLPPGADFCMTHFSVF